MAAISDVQIAAVASNAGIPDEELPTAVAVCLGESSAQPRAYNGHGGDHSFGLWQVNCRGNLGPARRAQYGIASNEALYEPEVAAQAMAKISSMGRNWRPWGAYTSGSYKANGRWERGVEAARLFRSGAAVETPKQAPDWHPTVNAADIYPGARGHSVYVVQRALSALDPAFSLLGARDRMGLMDEGSVSYLNKWVSSPLGGRWPATGYGNLDTLSRLGYTAPDWLQFSVTCDHVDDDSMYLYGGDAVNRATTEEGDHDA